MVRHGPKKSYGKILKFWENDFMVNREWTFGVYLVVDQERHGLLLRRTRKSTGETEHAYFFTFSGEALWPTDEIRNLCGDSVYRFDPNADEARVVRLLSECARYASKGGDPRSIPIGAIPRARTGDFAHDVSRLFAVSRSRSNRHSPLRRFLIDWEVFTAMVISKTSLDSLEVMAQEIECIKVRDLPAASRLTYLRSIESVLRLGTTVDPEWFRRSGPLGVDIEKQCIYFPSQRTLDLRKMLTEHHVVMLMGPRASGKTVTARCLAYSMRTEMPVHWFDCDESPSFNWERLLDELCSVSGVSIIENVHVAADNVQNIVRRLPQPSGNQVLLTSRRSPLLQQRDQYNDLLSVPQMRLVAFEDATTIAGVFLRNMGGMSVNTDEPQLRQLIRECACDYWLLSYGLKGRLIFGEHATAVDCMGAGVVADLQWLEGKNPHFPEVLISLAPLSILDAATDQNYLMHVLGFSKDTILALLARGEILRIDASGAPPSYKLPHASQGRAYWTYGVEYRNQCALPDYKEFVREYVMSALWNSAEVLARCEEDLRAEIIRDAVRDGVLPDIARNASPLWTFAPILGEVAGREPGAVFAVLDSVVSSLDRCGNAEDLRCYLAALECKGSEFKRVFLRRLGAKTVARLLAVPAEGMSWWSAVRKVASVDRGLARRAIREVGWCRIVRAFEELSDIGIVAAADVMAGVDPWTMGAVLGMVNQSRLHETALRAMYIDEACRAIAAIGRFNRGVARRWLLGSRRMLIEKVLKSSPDDNIGSCLHNLGGYGDQSLCQLFLKGIGCLELGQQVANTGIGRDLVKCLKGIHEVAPLWFEEHWDDIKAAISREMVVPEKELEIPGFVAELTRQTPDVADQLWEHLPLQMVARAFRKMVDANKGFSAYGIDTICQWSEVRGCELLRLMDRDRSVLDLTGHAESVVRCVGLLRRSHG